MRAIRKHVDVPADRAVTTSWIKSAIATVIMSIGVACTLALLPVEPTFSWWESCFTLVITVGVGIVVFGAAAYLLQMEEWKWILGGRG